ncbi:nucleotide-diphospho-sugar transferase [Trametes maxima]|nr:nucleotide-diphospho-sugar transferase [Trametes maxima]
MLMRRNMDELMDVELPSTNHIAAVHVCACNPRRIPSYPADWIPANCPHTSTSHPEALTSPPRIEETSPRTYALLNGGLIVLNPSLEVFEGLRRFLEESPEVQKFSFADQDLLATYFRGRWQPLPWCYNAAKTHRTIHPDVWRDDEVRCLHYVLADKPWKARPDAGDPEFKVVNQWWWDELEGLRAEMREVDTEGCKLVEENVAAGSEAEGSETVYYGCFTYFRF